jgi:adenylosuccinate synthase
LQELMVNGGVSAEVNAALDDGKKALVEGTQGFGLSLYHSEYYPHCTSRDTTASGFLSEVGISPRMVTEVVLVLRTFPIRVAGQQAGFLRDEITWEQIRAESGYPFVIEERTSVTKTIRRVGRFDWNLARAAIVVNRPTRIAINGLDYMDFNDFGVLQEEALSTKARVFLEELNKELATPIGYLGVGPALNQIIERGTPEKVIKERALTLVYSKKSQNRR